MEINENNGKSIYNNSPFKEYLSPTEVNVHYIRRLNLSVSGSK